MTHLVINNSMFASETKSEIAHSWVYQPRTAPRGTEQAKRGRVGWLLLALG